MTRDDYDNFVTMLTEAAEYFRDSQPLTDARIAIYFQSLQGYEYARVERAMVSLFGSRKFDGLPKVGEIVAAMVTEYKEQEKPAPLTWADLEGTSASARFTRYLIVSGKWREIGEDPTGGIWRNKFEQWKTAGQPMPPKGATILKGMEV